MVSLGHELEAGARHGVPQRGAKHARVGGSVVREQVAAIRVVAQLPAGVDVEALGGVDRLGAGDVVVGGAAQRQLVGDRRAVLCIITSRDESSIARTIL